MDENEVEVKGGKDEGRIKGVMGCVIEFVMDAYFTQELLFYP